jgi:hypothetical protein
MESMEKEFSVLSECPSSGVLRPESVMIYYQFTCVYTHLKAFHWIKMAWGEVDGIGCVF